MLCDLSSHLGEFKYIKMNGKIPITSAYDALVGSLVLAVTAPTLAKSKKALALAEDFAAELSTEEVEKAMKAAEAIIASDS